MATARHKHQRTGARSPLRLAAGATALAVCLLVLSAVLFPVAPAQATVAKGMCDGRIQDSSCDQTELLTPISEVGDDLRVGWVRLILNWPRIEPTRGVYNETELARLDYVIGELRARNVKVLLTICYMPAWASDQSFWDSPPMGYSKGYQVFYPIKDGCLDDLGRTGEYLASRFAGKANAYEVWNEPNLWPYIYPQRTASDPDFAPRTYLKMLKAYSAGIRRGDPTALILAGSTAPVGTNNVWRTSPQTFARYLRDHGAAQYFDAYSHHPYTPGGSANKAPDRPPNDTSTTVTLYNLGQLLRLFPGKPFYLTEYGYNTAWSNDFGGITVSKVQQAAWLRKAYSYAGRYPQVKALFWFLVQDAKPASGSADNGVYTGLRLADGSRKLSWFAFAGGNRLTISAPTRVRAGTCARVSGELSSAAAGALRGKTLVLQSRRVSGGSWQKVATTRTGSGGRYHFYARSRSSRVYRVVWEGVRTSATRTVRVY